MDDVFTASEQEIEDATKFMMERAKQAKIQLPRFCKDLNVANLSHSQAASLPFMCQNGTFDFGVQGAPFPSWHFSSKPSDTTTPSLLQATQLSRIAPPWVGSGC